MAIGRNIYFEEVSPSIYFFLYARYYSAIHPTDYWKYHSVLQKNVGIGLLLYNLFACTLSSLQLVSVIFGTAFPTFVYIFGRCFCILVSVLLQLAIDLYIVLLCCNSQCKKHYSLLQSTHIRAYSRVWLQVFVSFLISLNVFSIVTGHLS